MRAKFHVESVTRYEYGMGVKLRAVADSSPENNQFAKATPGGSLEMTITNPDAEGYFSPGGEYYLDFSPA